MSMPCATLRPWTRPGWRPIASWPPSVAPTRPPVACFQDDLEALLAIHRVPLRHRIRVRTTNLAERSFEEERRRTKIIPRLRTEQSAIKLVFATMMRAAECWTRVSINDLERHQLRLLRAELGLDPPPTEHSAQRRRRRTERSAA